MIEPTSVKAPRILVIRGGAIGDFILTLPVLAALRERFPGVEIEVLGYPRIASLALSGGLAKAVHAIESPGLAMFFARGGSFDLEWREFFGQFAIVISYLFDPDKIFETNVKSCGPRQFIAAQHRPDEAKSIHASDVFLKPLEQLTIFEGDPVARLELPGLVKRKNCLALHPGSGSESKNWPEQNWRELVAHLLDHSPLNLLLIGGEAEGDRSSAWATACRRIALKLLNTSRCRNWRRAWPSAPGTSATTPESRTWLRRLACPHWFCGGQAMRRFGGRSAKKSVC